MAAIRLPPAGELKEVSLVGNPVVSDTLTLADHMSLQKLKLDSVSGLTSLSFARKLTNLIVLSITNCSGLVDANELVDLVNLTELDLSGSSIEDTYFVEKMKNLTRASFNGCPRLFHLTSLDKLRSLEYLSLEGDVPSHDVERLRSNSLSSKRLVIIHDPFTRQYV